MIALARQAIRLYPRTCFASRHAVNVLRRGWIRQIQYLGDKWLLAASVPRKQAGMIDPDLAVFVTVCACSAIAWCLP